MLILPSILLCNQFWKSPIKIQEKVSSCLVYAELNSPVRSPPPAQLAAQLHSPSQTFHVRFDRAIQRLINKSHALVAALLSNLQQSLTLNFVRKSLPGANKPPRWPPAAAAQQRQLLADPSGVQASQLMLVQESSMQPRSRMLRRRRLGCSVDLVGAQFS